MMIVLFPSTSHLLPSFPQPFSWASSYLLSSFLLCFVSSLDEVQRELRSAGFSEVKSIGQLDGQTFCLDPHCGDVLVLPAQLKAQLCSTKLLSDHKLIIQVQAAHRVGKGFWQEQSSPRTLSYGCGNQFSPFNLPGYLSHHFGNGFAQIDYKTEIPYTN